MIKPSLFWLSIWIFAALPARGQAAPQPENVPQLLSRMEARAAQLQDYTVDGEGETGGKPTRFKFYFKQPDLVRIDAHRGQVTVEPNGEIRGGRGLVGKSLAPDWAR